MSQLANLNSLPSTVRYSMNYDYIENPSSAALNFNLFGTGNQISGAPCKFHLPRLIIDVAYPESRNEDGEILYCEQTLTVGFKTKYSTFRTEKFELMLGAGLLGRYSRGIKFDNLDEIAQEALKGQIREFKNPEFCSNIDGRAIAPGQEVLLESVYVDEACLITPQTVRKSELQKPELCRYLLRNFMLLKKKNIEARTKNQDIPELVPGVPVTSEYFGN